MKVLTPATAVPNPGRSQAHSKLISAVRGCAATLISATGWQDAGMAEMSGETESADVATTAAVSDLISVEEIEAAAELLRGVVRYTPMESSRPLNLLVGGPAYLKCENL